MTRRAAGSIVVRTDWDNATRRMLAIEIHVRVKALQAERLLASSEGVSANAA